MSDQNEKSIKGNLPIEVKSPIDVKSPIIASDNSAEDTCVVCFKNFDIYSIGECDHPVCYECSTRMRVLCQRNECPICRQVLSKVIFTKEKLSYRELERKNRSEFYNKRYKIGFSNFHIQQSFYELLDHACPKCDAPPYRTFLGLKNHVRKEHDLHYCDLCTEHLKIFTFERRCYTQADLGLHRTKGDADNKSHRGHPLCEYCNKRYLDRDELFRHLRREHYFCHFCEANGVNEFYRDYAALADHFRQDHYLCEEDKCATEQFIGAFRTEIDYKAHIAKDHAKSLNKQQAKQTRTLQLEITLGRRGRQAEQNVASVRTRGNEQEQEVIDEPTTSQQSQRTITIDAQNEEDFPSLGGAAAAANLSLTRPPPSSMRMRSATAGLARTKENFPALGASDGGTNAQREQNQSTSISKVLKNSTTSNAGTATRTAPTAVNMNSGMVIHVSNRPVQNLINGHNTKKTNMLDFPALPEVATKKQVKGIYEDLMPASEPIARNVMPARRQMLADDYVSVANPCTSKKLQLVQKQEKNDKAKEGAQKATVPKLTNLDFPSLVDNNVKATSAVTNTWAKTTSDKKQRELENRKSKVAPAPVLPNNNKTVNKQIANNNAILHDVTKKDKDKDKKNKDKDKNNKEKKAVTETNTKTNGKIKEKNNNENKNTDNLIFTTTELSDALNCITNSDQTIRPPPGFGLQPAALKPPPGFLSQVTVNSVAKSPNDLTFTSSLGEKYSIMKTHNYAPPNEAANRNQRLIALFKEALKTRESFDEFHHISQLFREGLYNAAAYYEHCQAALKDKFDHTFPELLALLPDISKQQALYLVHSQRLNSLPVSQRKSLAKLEVCAICKQVLLQNDAAGHHNMHDLKMNFPTLNTKSKKSATPRK